MNVTRLPVMVPASFDRGHDTFSIRETAAHFGFKQKQFVQFLIDHGIAFYYKLQNMNRLLLNADFVNSRYGEVYLCKKQHKQFSQSRFTLSGLTFLKKQFPELTK